MDFRGEGLEPLERITSLDAPHRVYDAILRDSLVRERLVPPERLRSMSPDEQYVIAAGKDIPRDPMHLNHARYWSRPDTRFLADPNPFVERKRRLR